MATVSVVVDPGAGGDYLSLNAAEADNYGAGTSNFVANTVSAFCELQCTNGSADSTTVNDGGRTTSNAYHAKIFTETHRHLGYYPTSGNYYRLEATSGTLLALSDSYLEVDGVPFYNKSQTTYDNGVRANEAEYTISNCIFRGDGAAISDDCVGIYLTAIGASAFVFNNIVYDWGGGGSIYGGIFVNVPTAKGFIYHNTLVDNTVGIERSGGDVPPVLKNNLAFDNTNDYTGTFDTASVTNGYTGGGSGPTGDDTPVDLGTASASIFVDPGNDNFHLLDQTSPAYAAGTSLTGDDLDVTADIDGRNRLATPCIGADEVVVRLTGGAVTFPALAGDGAGTHDAGTTYQAAGAVTFGTLDAAAIAYANTTHLAGGSASFAAVSVAGEAIRGQIHYAGGAIILSGVTVNGAALRYTTYVAEGSLIIGPLNIGGRIDLPDYVAPARSPAPLIVLPRRKKVPLKPKALRPERIQKRKADRKQRRKKGKGRRLSPSVSPRTIRRDLR
jgi:hypothetical protein